MQITLNINEENEADFMAAMIALHPKPDPTVSDLDYIVDACATQLSAAYKVGKEQQAITDCDCIAGIVTG